MLQVSSYPVMFCTKSLVQSLYSVGLVAHWNQTPSNTKDVLEILIFFKTSYSQQEVKKFNSASHKQDTFVDGNSSKIW